MDDVHGRTEPATNWLDDLEKPVAGDRQSRCWGSDVVAQTLRELDFDFIALVPGSSFRGLHDSLVNCLGNTRPKMVLCLHEEHAVAIADGYGRASDRPMAVALHANVGLMHASMAIYNAWCDRVPMVIVGATGPVDAHKRRPWIDWVHTARDQGALIRPFVKWDDQPASAEAAVEALLRAHQVTTTAPFGPSYVCLDVTTQEEALDRPVTVPDARRFSAPALPVPAPTALDRIVGALAKARRPVFLYGRMARGLAEWQRRIDLAEATGAAVLTSIHNPSVFPTSHHQHVLPPCGEQRTDAERRLIAQADLIVSFDWMDLAGYLRSCTDTSQSQHPIGCRVVHCSLDSMLANGWSMDHQALAAVDENILAHPDSLVAALLERSADGRGIGTDWRFDGPHWTTRLPSPRGGSEDRIALGDFALAMRAHAIENDVTFVRLPLGWPTAASHFTHPLSYLGKDGGGAVGVGPGHAVGAALALKDSGRIVTAVLGDGDTLMGINALWSASHLRLPLLVVVANNTSYFNDERHQERVAIARGRPAENKWIGQRLSDPEVDICAMARAQGFETIGPLHSHAELVAALRAATQQVRHGGRVLIDARIEDGYANMFGQEDAA
ncbi:thiamine pyrophosphate-binding protein [Polymorphum gilvum]|uniref:Acetolactate synthase II n=1 Tax=Polymorphum gilvum (strain LMG 25793 / CGMCC 1.9160 / SL003B-26A1) TaxID=991905 RepID=F2IZJ2_POLGS|nr:thiamine pyrophosphate-binding protein [Polymorphum gilvum]ADZ69549.1 Acetolactate synthase II [Polymorphum gilvum SL003B-26A1]